MGGLADAKYISASHQFFTAQSRIVGHLASTLGFGIKVEKPLDVEKPLTLHLGDPEADGIKRWHFIDSLESPLESLGFVRICIYGQCAKHSKEKCWKNCPKWPLLKPSPITNS